MAGFPNRGGGTNPLPDWYTSMSRAELRAVAHERAVPVSELQRISCLLSYPAQAEALAAAEKRWAREVGAATREAGARWFREARADRDLAWGVSPPPDVPEDGLRGPLRLRLRLWWMRQWLPGLYGQRNRSLLVAFGMAVVSNVPLQVFIWGNPWWWIAFWIVVATLFTMTITRSWRADPEEEE